jgi:hypothetical protein
MGEMPFVFTLTLGSGNTVTGTVTAAEQTGKLTGTFDSVNRLLRLSVDYGGGEGGNVEAAVVDDTLTGKHLSPDGRVIEFTAKREAPMSATPQAPSTTSAPAPVAEAAPRGPAQQQPRGAGRRGGRTAGPGSGASGPAPGGNGGEPSKPEDAEAVAWLKYSDDQRNHEGFVEWKPFDHPTLGKVEIGGFVPGFQMNPPASELDQIGLRQTDFVIEVLNRRPRLTVQGPSVTKLAEGLFEIRLGIVNEGYLPTATAMARKARSIFPSVVRISTPIDNIITGDRATRTYGVGGSGDRVTYRWIIRADNGSDVTIDITNPHLGDHHITFKAAPTD